MTIDASNKRFGRLVALTTVTRANRRVWACRCDCGTEITVPYNQLASGNTKSCGCLSRDSASGRLTTHGLSDTPEYGVWKSMRNRCQNKNVAAYKNYGGRGISVCPRWESFECFIQDMGRRPSPKHTLDRIDNNGPYELANCRWTSYLVQARNQRRSQFLTAFGQTKLIVIWAEEIGIPYKTLWKRLKDGIDPERALTPTPLPSGLQVPHANFDRNRKTNRQLTAFGQTKLLCEWAEQTGFSAAAIYQRIKHGWAVEDALSKPLRPHKSCR